MKTKNKRFLELIEPLMQNLENFALAMCKNRDTAKDLVANSGEIAIYNVLGEKILSVVNKHACSLQKIDVYQETTPSLLRNATPQEGNFRIDVSHLPRGVYFVRVGERVEKFVKR